MRVNQAKPSIDVDELDDDQLLLLHMELHSYYKEFQQGRELEDWTEDDLIQVHDRVVQELEQRDVTHQELSSLDEAQIEQKKPEFEVTEWAKGFVQTDDPVDYIQKLEADWFLEAEKAVNQIDETTSLTDYVGLSSTPVSELDKDVQQNIGKVKLSSVIGFHINYETGDSAVLTQTDDDYLVYQNEEEVESTDDLLQAYEAYEEVTDFEEPEQEEERDSEQGEMFVSQEPHRWYAWDQSEAEQWLINQGFPVNEPEEQAGFLTYSISEQELFDTMFEWRGPVSSHQVTDPRLDGRPYLVQVGFPTEEPQEFEHRVISSISFQVEAGPTAHEVNTEAQQVQIDSSVDKDFYWMVHDENSIQTWLQQQEIPTGEGNQEGQFYQYKVKEAEEFDNLKTVWEGARTPPGDGELAGGQWPRRVTYGIDQEGERTLQKLEFLVEKPYSQLAEEYVKSKGLGREHLEEELNNE